jgi:ureidoacrylate peracid hydrolase
MTDPSSGGASREALDQAAGEPLRPLTLAEKVDPATTALLVIDVQNDYIHPDGYSARSGSDTTACIEVVPRILQFIGAARAAGVYVIYTRNWHRPETDSPAWLDRLARGGRTREQRAGRADTWGAAWYGVEPMPGEEIVSKFRYDAFLGTNLEFLLRARGIRTVICTGTTTEICVESTARAAIMRDFHLVVAEDCCASNHLDAHHATLKTLKSGFGQVTTADEIEATWVGATEALARRQPASVSA